MIKAKMVADSLSPQNERLSSMMLTLPRFILAELNTHRILSKNSASSRAIPFNKMIESVTNNPFIPIAWQKTHSGMQGNEYFSNPKEIAEKEMYWLTAKSSAVNMAEKLYNHNTTKQLCNRLLEPFMWHTVLISGTEWENFFNLRCPVYELNYINPFNKKSTFTFKSRKDYLNKWDELTKNVTLLGETVDPYNWTNLDWLKLNKGQAEIHMMALAEAMWDAMNESTPKQLQPGQWHIPFEDKISFVGNLVESIDVDNTHFSDYDEQNKIKISTAMAARTSYTVVSNEKEFGYDNQIALHDRMAIQVPFHASPFEHCAKVMPKIDYNTYIKRAPIFNSNSYGWCRNYRGFIQYRHILESDKNK